MLSTLTPFVLFAFVNLLGAMSPGPDFAIVARYGLTGSRRAAFLAAAGIASALLFHVCYCLFGIEILQNSRVLFISLQAAGALYLAYLGIRLLRANEKAQTIEKKEQKSHSPFAQGFLTNLLNPKASLFLLSIFSEFIDPTTPLWSKGIYGILIPLTAFGWFSFLSLMLTHQRFLPHLQKYQAFFTKTMGVMLLALSLLVLSSFLL